MTLIFFRCRADDQYCCGYTCCFKPSDQDPNARLLTSWYFWSLVSLVLLVFGCIIFSFALSNLKRKSSSWARAPSAWLGLMSGGSVNLGNLATTQGITDLNFPRLFLMIRYLGNYCCYYQKNMLTK